MSKRSDAAHKAWATRRSKYSDDENRLIGSATLKTARIIDDTRTPSGSIWFRLDKAAELGWTFILSRGEDGNINAGATLPLCNGDHVVTTLVAVDVDAYCSNTERIFKNLLEQIESYYDEENK